MLTGLWIFENCRNRICVDYNFLTGTARFARLNSTSRVWVVPNAAPALAVEKIAEKFRSPHDRMRILFARRFEPFRGTRLMADVATKLLSRFPNIGFTFAGEGSDRGWLQERFKQEPRVTICKIEYSRRMEAYFQHDIVVVPSYGSEGTSLSAIEAMAAGSAVVATDSGGMTNLILNGFNGLLVPPEADEIERSLTLLIENRELREKIASAGHQTAIVLILRSDMEEQVDRHIGKSRGHQVDKMNTHRALNRQTAPNRFTCVVFRPK